MVITFMIENSHVEVGVLAPLAVLTKLPPVVSPQGNHLEGHLHHHHHHLPHHNLHHHQWCIINFLFITTITITTSFLIIKGGALLLSLPAQVAPILKAPWKKRNSESTLEKKK